MVFVSMKWSPEEEYIRFQTSMTAVQSHLGISCIRWYLSKELSPYIIYILEYINTKLILSGASTIYQKLTEFSEIYQDGTDKIINKEIEDLLYEMKIDSSDPDYREDLFCLAWGNLMTSIYTTLQYNYSQVFATQEEDCHTQCSCPGSSDSELGIPDSGSWESSKIGCGCTNK